MKFLEKHIRAVGIVGIAAVIGLAGYLFNSTDKERTACYRQEPNQSASPNENSTHYKFSEPIRIYGGAGLGGSNVITNMRIGDFDRDGDLDILGLMGDGSLVLYDNLTPQGEKGKLEVEVKE